jgi:hypothetical protein
LVLKYRILQSFFPELTKYIGTRKMTILEFENEEIKDAQLIFVLLSFR